MGGVIDHDSMSSRFRWVLWTVAVVLCSGPGTATADRVAVLEFTGDGSLADSELLYLSDEVRASALDLLDRNRWEVITRENTVLLLRENRATLESCLGECEVEMGRTIGADLVIAGDQVKMGSLYRIRLKAYDTNSGQLLSSEKAEARTVDELVSTLEGICGNLLRPIGGRRTIATPGHDEDLGESTEAWKLELAKEHVVTFETSPRGTAVYVDGDYICDTPCSRPVTEGGHDFTLKLPRYEPVEVSHRITTSFELQHELSPSFGWLTIRTDPPDLRIEVDGQDIGTSPIQRREQMPGTVEVWLRDARYHDKGKRVTVQRGQEKEISIKPTPRLGGLKVVVQDRSDNAVGATVSIDGSRVGTSPWAGELLVGEHHVEVSHEGMENSRSVRVVEEEVEEVRFELTPSRVQRSAATTVVAPTPSFTAPKRKKSSRSERFYQQKMGSVLLVSIGASFAAGGFAVHGTTYWMGKPNQSLDRCEKATVVGAIGLIVGITGATIGGLGALSLPGPRSGMRSGPPQGSVALTIGAALAVGGFVVHVGTYDLAKRSYDTTLCEWSSGAGKAGFAVGIIGAATAVAGLITAGAVDSRFTENETAPSTPTFAVLPGPVTTVIVQF